MASIVHDTRHKPLRKHVQKALRPLLTVTLVGAAFMATLAAAQEASFYDVPPMHWAHDAVSKLAGLGVLTGYPEGRFDGTRTATRYELAVVAARLLEVIDEITGAAGSSTSAVRLAELEAALNNAASLAYTRRLEARIVALEATLNEQQGTATFPARQDSGADTAALPRHTPTSATSPERQTPSASRNSTRASDVGEVRFSSRPAHPFFVGISPGTISTAGDVYLSVQAGYDALIGPVGPVARLTFNGGNRELRFSVDALAKADLLVDELKIYGGLGLGTTVRPDGSSLLLEVPFGGEYFITERASLFMQLTTSYGFAPINDVDAELSSGINLRF